MLNQFSRSIKEWLLDYNELEINNMVASGSTCKVFQGKYKNIKVAIKKISGIKNA